MAKRAKIMKVSDEGTVEWEVEKEEAPPAATQTESKPKFVSVEPKNELCGTPQLVPVPDSPAPPKADVPKGLDFLSLVKFLNRKN